MKKSVNVSKYCGPFILAALVAAVACQKEPVSFNAGEDRVQEEDLRLSPVFLRGTSTGGNVAYSLLTEGGTAAVQNVYASSGTPIDFDQTIVVEAAPERVESFAASHRMEYKPLPAPFYEIRNHGIATIRAGKTSSEELQIKLYATNPIGNRLQAGRYLLPLRLKASAQTAADRVFYLSLNIRRPFKGNAPLYTGGDGFFVFYINTAEYDPRLVTDYLVVKDGPDPAKSWCRTVGNLINLRKATVGYDKTSGRAMFDLGADLRYVLEHEDTYLLPLREEGRKICLTIEGGACGLGFCNLNDAQIEDFVAQVRRVMASCPLDGISLWDRNSGYEKSVEKGLPERNTTSYPKLIKALREMLGPDRLLTLADYGAPTEYFWDKAATGGIEVGKYIDYAWSGYCDTSEGLQLVDPYHQGAAGVSTLHPRKPIPLLDESRYGCVNYPWRPAKADWENDYKNILNYMAGKPNNVIVFEDLRTKLQDNMETSWEDSFMFCIHADHFMTGGNYIYLFDSTKLAELPDMSRGYGKWIKDW